MTAFRLKRFTIEQTTASMKVGTDGVLLGAWIFKEGAVQEILDIGTGTGLIALMLAQKFPEASIDAIDIDEGAVIQATANAKNSGWSKRIQVEQIALADFIPRNKKKYDIIACNPPYFMKGWKIGNEQRKKARDAAHLPFEQLIEVAKCRLAESGSLNLILPVEEGKIFIHQLVDAGLFCKRCTSVITKEGLIPKRFLLEVVKKPVNTVFADLVIEHAGLNNFTAEYKQLTGDFYLHF